MQKIQFGKTEPIYREYRDQDYTLVDPTWVSVSIYDPNGTFLDSGTPTKESTGVYYYDVSLSTASTTSEGVYQAYWEGNIGGTLVTEDDPLYFNGIRIPWQITKPEEIISSVRRMTGDTDPESYRIATRDMYYFLSDAVDEVQAEYNFGYTLTIAPTSVSWNQTLYNAPFTLFKLKTLMLVMESTLNDFMYYSGNVTVGDIKVNVTNMLKMRADNLKRLEEKYRALLYEIKMNGATGVIIDTYVQNIIMNDSWSRIVYE